jgi:hypothetical protein
MQIGLAEAAVLLKKVSSYGDPRLFALSCVAKNLSEATQPLVPERVFMAPGGAADGSGANAAAGLVGVLLNLLIAEKSGFQLVDGPEQQQLRELAENLSREALVHLHDRETAAQSQ